MIKNINHQNSNILSPFTAVKAWELYNNHNDDLLLLEPSRSGVEYPDTFLAQEYIDYSGTPTLNRDCNIALEQQEHNDAIYEEGVIGSGIFFPDSEPRNDNGSYKRLVYDQMEAAFYNQYRNPLNIFGMENIDFPLSQTNRYLANQFLMFSIPRRIMGDRLVEGTIQMYDDNVDDNVEIRDDSYGNLIATRNLFSQIQEVRPLGNVILSGTSSVVCPLVDPYEGILYFSGSELMVNSTDISDAYGSITQIGGSWVEVHGHTCPGLNKLFIQNNALTTIDLTNHSALISMSCFNNQITSLDISTNTSLQYIDAGTNPLTETAVDNILINMDTFGNPSGSVILTNTEIPSAAAATAITNLTSKGWILQLDS